ncbi:uncharacterized protein LOC112568683 [Pomacea canaliculata]|uniref:uncharacterized protein LOC112568683 n=1 Tax=Pomacea canaliculata TaxID=400727 RepID=UPI000D728C86|nr:uncharacterized protein LOC112568683 [Pomacea canaliculata]
MVLGTQAQVLFILSTVALFDVGLSVECSHMTNTREWSLYVVCWDKSQQSFDNCQWDVVDKTTNTRVAALQTLPSSEKLFNCSGKLPLPLSTGEYSYYLLLPNQTWHNVLNLTIDDPGELTLKNCPREVSEGDNVYVQHNEKAGHRQSYPGQDRHLPLYTCIKSQVKTTRRTRVR